MRLEELQEMGALPRKLNIVNDGDSVITYGKIKQADNEFQNTCEKAIVVDDYKWIAVSDEVKSIETAEIIYSCDGKNCVGTYNRNRHIFFRQELRGNKLYTVAQIKLFREKENKSMAEAVNLEDMNLDGLDGLEVQTQPAATANKEAKPLTESQQRTLEIKEKISQANIGLADNARVTLFNQKNGRLIAFVTKTDKGIKVSKVKVPKVDANGVKIVRTDLSQDQLQKIEAAKKDPNIKVPASYYEKDTALVFKESKPSAPIAAIVATPAGGMVDYNSLFGNSDEVLKVTDDTTLQVQVMGMELFYNAIAGLYGGRIKESEDVMGPRATWLQEKFTQSKKTGDDTGRKTFSIRPSIQLADRKARATVLTTGNYIPMRKFVTMSQAQIKSEEDAAKLQLNIEAAFKKSGSYDQLRDQDKKLIGTNGTTSEYFKVGNVTPIKGVTKFDEKGVEVADIQIPVRTKKPTKDNTGFTYGYEYEQLTDGGELYKKDRTVDNILKVAGLSVEEFSDQVAKSTKRSSSRGSSKVAISVDEFMAAQKVSSIEVNKSFDTRSIAAQLAGMQG